MSGHKIKLDGYVWDEKKGLRRDPKDLDASARKKRQKAAIRIKQRKVK